MHLDVYLHHREQCLGWIHALYKSSYFISFQGKVCTYEKSDGTPVFMSTPFFCQVMNAVFDGPLTTENQMRELAVADATLVMRAEDLVERAGKAKITVELVSFLCYCC
jgi:hypothetical protein